MSKKISPNLAENIPIFNVEGKIPPASWIRHLTNLFMRQPQRSTKEKVYFAKSYLEGTAAEWFQYWIQNQERNQRIVCWDEFCDGFYLQFEKMWYRNYERKKAGSKEEKEHQRRLEEDKRRAREEEKKRILLEEERRKVAARQKLLELEEKIARREALKKKQVAAILIQKYVRRHQAQKYYKRLQSASKIIQAGFRGMTSRNEFRIKKQIKAAIKIQTQWRSYRDSSYYQKLTKATIMIQSTWKGKATREQVKIKRKEQGPKIPTSKDITKSTSHWKEQKSKVHDQEMSTDQLRALHIGPSKDRDDKDAPIIIGVESKIICINLSYTCLKVITLPCEHGTLWWPSSFLHKITREELPFFFNKLCECRIYIQVHVEDIYLRQLTIFKKESPLTMYLNQESKFLIKWTKVPRKEQWRRCVSTKLDSSHVEDDDQHKEGNQKGIPKYIRQQRARKQGKRTRIAAASKWMILLKVEDLWRHMGTRHKWPNLCYEDATHSSRGDGMI